MISVLNLKSYFLKKKGKVLKRFLLMKLICIEKVGDQRIVDDYLTQQ